MAQRSQKSVRKCARHTVKPRAVTLVRREEPQLPLHAKEMRSGLKATVRTAPSLISLWKNIPLPTPVKTFLRANMSSLYCDFSYADVPSRVLFSCFIKGSILLYVSQFCYCPFFSFQYRSMGFTCNVLRVLSRSMKTLSFTNAGDTVLALTWCVTLWFKNRLLVVLLFEDSLTK